MAYAWQATVSCWLTHTSFSRVAVAILWEVMNKMASASDPQVEEDTELDELLDSKVWSYTLINVPLQENQC